MAAQQIGDQHLLRPFCLEKVGRFVDMRADVEPDGATQETEDVGNAPAPIDQLLVGEPRRQGHAELRDGPYAGPLPARAEAPAPCSAKKTSTLPNQPPVENRCSTGAGAMSATFAAGDASMVSLPTISGKVRAPCRASALPSLVTDRRRALDAQDPELS